MVPLLGKGIVMSMVIVMSTVRVMSMVRVMSRVRVMSTVRVVMEKVQTGSNLEHVADVQIPGEV